MRFFDRFNWIGILRRARPSILAYHGVVERPTPLDLWTDTGLETFAEQIRYIRRRRTLVTLDDFVSRTHRGTPLPDNAVAITFDDGYENNFTLAYPILRQYDVPATIYLTTDLIATDQLIWPIEVCCAICQTTKSSIPSPSEGERPLPLDTLVVRRQVADLWVQHLKTVPDAARRANVRHLLDILGTTRDEMGIRHTYRMLDWNQVRTMHNEGLVTFGGHTCSHPILVHTEQPLMRRELSNCKRQIEHQLGTEVRHFAYPNGDWNAQVRDAVCDAGYTSAATTERSWVRHGQDSFELPRLEMRGWRGASRLKRLLATTS